MAYEKTLAAFEAEEGSLWGVVDALAEEMPGYCSASDLGECQQFLAGHGIDKGVQTIKGYRIAGRLVEDATARDAKVLRAQSVSTVRDFANMGAAPEAAAAAIREYQRTTGHARMGSRAVAVWSQATQRSPDRRSDDPEEWTAKDWDRFDGEVVKAVKTLLTAFNCLHRNLYVPSVAASAQLALIRQQDIDAELASLLED